jgi:hypothetical protein
VHKCNEQGANGCAPPALAARLAALPKAAATAVIRVIAKPMPFVSVQKFGCAFYAYICLYIFVPNRNIYRYTYIYIYNIPNIYT